MTEKKVNIDIYDEVKGHSIYELLIKGLDPEQAKALDGVIKEFSVYMQDQVLGPAMDTVERARTATAQKLVMNAANKMGTEVTFEEASSGEEEVDNG